MRPETLFDRARCLLLYARAQSWTKFRHRYLIDTRFERVFRTMHAKCELSVYFHSRDVSRNTDTRTNTCTRRTKKESRAERRIKAVRVLYMRCMLESFNVLFYTRKANVKRVHCRLKLAHDDDADKRRVRRRRILSMSLRSRAVICGLCVRLHTLYVCRMRFVPVSLCTLSAGTCLRWLFCWCWCCVSVVFQSDRPKTCSVYACFSAGFPIDDRIRRMAASCAAECAWTQNSSI